MRYVFQKKRYTAAASVLDALGGLFFRAHHHHFPEKFSPKKILVIRLDHMGDILPSTAIPQALKENFPEARIHFLTNSMGEALLKNNPYVDRVWVFNPNWFARGARKRREGLEKMARQLRKERFGLGFSLRGDLRENWLLWRAAVKFRIGYGITGGSFLLTHAVPYASGAHESKHAFDLLRFAGISTEILPPKIYWSPEEEEDCRQRLALKGFTKDKWLGIQVDAGTAAKEWPWEHYRKLLELLERRTPQTRVVFFGSSHDRAKRLEAVLKNEGSKKWLNLVGYTDTRELFFLLKSLRFCVGPDSGPMHVAASFDIPTLFLFSGTNIFEAWKPLGESAYVLRHEVPCSPCRKTVCPIEGHPCMSGIQPESVMSWLEEHRHSFG